MYHLLKLPVLLFASNTGFEFVDSVWPNISCNTYHFQKAIQMSFESPLLKKFCPHDH